MQTQGNRAVQKRQSLDMIDIRRNPYLVDYEEQKRLRQAANEGIRRSGAAAGGGSRRPVEVRSAEIRRASGTGSERNRRPAGGRSYRSSGVRSERSHRSSGVRNERNCRPADGRSHRSSGERNERSRKASGAGSERPQRSLDLIEIGREQRTAGAGSRRNAAAAAKKRRRKQVFRRKMMAAAWILCIFMIVWLVLLKKGNASELEQSGGSQEIQTVEGESGDASSVIVQGISREQFVKHPAWTEDFLPVNEFSRPGETLPEVRDIFVHYTANPGTSAAQNRSYFEQQKDMHEASVSAHFIIGCDGEIIQCVPLDEIAYAVQTRNYDSISIECCYKASDGSFTQETYDSLIGLLAWLTDTYDLDTSHILRHYDCGGKKCPLYYTEHEDAWAKLKEDVAAGQTE